MMVNFGPQILPFYQPNPDPPIQNRSAAPSRKHALDLPGGDDHATEESGPVVPRPRSPSAQAVHSVSCRLGGPLCVVDDNQKVVGALSCVGATKMSKC